MPNRLAAESSPYLLQHANNPVDWHAWGPEALERARREDRPILVSIGYSACHWCHVMERESFEDEATARLMNERFVNIKVDREERPDVDAIYMEAVQAMSGHGGWPLNVFLTPEGRPFYGGTYFPPEPRHGMPSWRTVLESVADAYRNRREDVTHNADALTVYIQRSQGLAPSPGALSSEILVEAYQGVTSQLDWDHGGFGSAPKFPQPLALDLMLRFWRRLDARAALDFVRLTLDRMAAGGIFDQLGGGFHRYSVDAEWLVPHFEKMLYDNALLMRVYLHAYQVTGEPAYREIVERTADYLLRDMRAPEGGFWSAEDADSEGEEGRYYVWTPEEVEQVVGPDAGLVARRYGITASGNFEGRSILTAARTLAELADDIGAEVEEVRSRLQRARATLLEVRSRRIRPEKDTKILAGWNALAIRALAEAGSALSRPDYLAAAEDAAAFTLAAMRPGGRLIRSWRNGPGTIPAFLEDYGFLLEALLSLYESASDPSYFHAAEETAAQMAELFWDADAGVFFDTASDAHALVVRPRGLFDNPIPSGNAAASFGLLRLHSLTGESRYLDLALPAIESARDALPRAPLGFPYLLSALDFHLSLPLQIAIVIPQDGDAEGLMRTVFERYLPNRVIAVGNSGSSPLLQGRDLIEGRPTAFVCERFSCRLPVTTPAELAAQLDERATGVSGSSRSP